MFKLKKLESKVINLLSTLLSRNKFLTLNYEYFINGNISDIFGKLIYEKSCIKSDFKRKRLSHIEHKDGSFNILPCSSSKSSFEISDGRIYIRIDKLLKNGLKVYIKKKILKTINC